MRPVGENSPRSNVIVMPAISFASARRGDENGLSAVFQQSEIYRRWATYQGTIYSLHRCVYTCSLSASRADLPYRRFFRRHRQLAFGHSLFGNVRASFHFATIESHRWGAACGEQRISGHEASMPGYVIGKRNGGRRRPPHEKWPPLCQMIIIVWFRLVIEQRDHLSSRCIAASLIIKLVINGRHSLRRVGDNIQNTKCDNRNATLMLPAVLIGCAPPIRCNTIGLSKHRRKNNYGVPLRLSSSMAL